MRAQIEKIFELFDELSLQEKKDVVWEMQQEIEEADEEELSNHFSA